MNSPLLEKSLDFATQIVIFYEEFAKSKKDTTITKQLLRSATSIGANVNEALYGNSRADFIAKLQIALKECYETEYWLEVFVKSEIIEKNAAKELYCQCGTIRRMLISSINTAKSEKT